jgi:hypothetical protein
MSTIPSGAVKFSDIQSVLGGTNPIKFSEYYANATEGYATGVSNIPNINASISMSLFRGKSKASGNGLYTFSSHTFTNASATGRFGPTLSQCRSTYSSATWAQDTTNNNLNMTTQGIQLWKVPATGSYSIECFGASGGAGSTLAGGKGAIIKGNFTLTQGQVLGILVGQEGGVKTNTCNTGGGGGTFVWNTNSTTEPLIVAGGGGGTNTSAVGLDANTGGSGTGSGGTPGTSGNGASPGGSGWKSNGTAGLDNNNSGCTRPLEGGIGGASLVTITVGDGGFGGGASASGQPCSNGGAGGGGGYSGGSGPAATSASSPGGGGGSYNSGTNSSSSIRTDTGSGYVVITANFTITQGSGLYAFSSHTFTNATVSGRTGPTLSQCRSAYSSATWAQDTVNNYLNMTTQGIQEWVVPITASYTITCAGAGGGAIAQNATRGRGIVTVSTFSLTQGDKIFILVGQQAAQFTGAGGTGGGGGSFVATGTSLAGANPLIVAGGGSGAGNGENARDAVSTSIGQNGDSNTRPHPGLGQGGADSRDAGQGAGGAGGFSSNGESSSTWGSQFGYGFKQGGQGGISSSANRVGGFGGGAGTHENNTGGGAGGGYSGGSAPSHGGSFAGGPGSSFSTTTMSVSSYNTGHGYVTITKV